MTTHPCFEPPAASIEMLIAVYPAAILTLYSVITKSFPTVVATCSRPVYIAFVVMVSGVCLLAKKPTARAIAEQLGIVSHDALTRMLTPFVLDGVLADECPGESGAVVPNRKCLAQYHDSR